ncbi:MAG: radical SAM family heme chaperone HemW [marine benthic group bacterium]|nr:radical SAM family heme chaperone HemW [Gemmatimonadota bacterium]
MSTKEEAPGLALYVHVPFCARRCHYCDFAVTRSPDPPVDEWLASIDADLSEWRRELCGTDLPALDTIFVGGGTPTLLGARGMESLGDCLARHFRWDEETIEWSAEANPNSLTADTAIAWRGIGVNRLSLGVQSFDDRALQWLGRLHDGREACEAVERALTAGFDNLSLDLIFGLPQEIERSWQADLHKALELGVVHLSTYGLTAEPETPLGRNVAHGRVALAGQEQYVEEYLIGVNLLGSHHFTHYEVSNFARSGYECRHNWHYWIGTEYLGVGPSAHSYIRGQRTWNVRDWQAYRAAALAGETVREGRELPSGEQRRLEALWLGLRTRRGIDLDRFGISEAIVAGWISDGRAIRQGARVKLTPHGWLVLDDMVAELAARTTEDE